MLTSNCNKNKTFAYDMKSIQISFIKYNYILNCKTDHLKDADVLTCALKIINLGALN